MIAAMGSSYKAMQERAMHAIVGCMVAAIGRFYSSRRPSAMPSSPTCSNLRVLVPPWRPV